MVIEVILFEAEEAWPIEFFLWQVVHAFDQQYGSLQRLFSYYLLTLTSS